MLVSGDFFLRAARIAWLCEYESGPRAFSTRTGVARASSSTERSTTGIVQPASATSAAAASQARMRIIRSIPMVSFPSDQETGASPVSAEEVGAATELVHDPARRAGMAHPRGNRQHRARRVPVTALLEGRILGQFGPNAPAD